MSAIRASVAGVLFAVSTTAAFADAPDGRILATELTGGTVQSATIVSAESGMDLRLSFRDTKGTVQSLDIKIGDKIEGLLIESAEITTARATGGTLHWKSSVAFDPKRGTVEPDALTSTSLKAATLKNVKFRGGQQTWKLSGQPVSGDFGNAGTLQVGNGYLEAVNVAKPTVPQSLVQAQQPRSGGTEARDVSTVGDYFVFNVNVKHFKPSDPDINGEVTAPRGSCFRVSQELDQPDPGDPSKTRKIARGRFETGLFGTGWFPRLLLPPYSCEGEKSIHFDTALSYDVPRQLILEDRDRFRYGWTYGVLVTPFKFYKKAREFSAGASVGPYLGYRLRDRPGSTSVVALSIGAATANVKTNNADGTTSDSSTTGLTAAVAYLLDIKGTFNVGIIAGSDFFSKSQNIATSNKLWFGLSFGYKIN